MLSQTQSFELELLMLMYLIGYLVKETFVLDWGFEVRVSACHATFKMVHIGASRRQRCSSRTSLASTSGSWSTRTTARGFCTSGSAIASAMICAAGNTGRHTCAGGGATKAALAAMNKQQSIETDEVGRSEAVTSAVVVWYGTQVRTRVTKGNIYTH